MYSTKGTIYDITMRERRMTIVYWVGYEPRTFAGWVSLSIDGHGVIARRVGGRNSWRITTIDDIERVDLG